MVNAMEGKNGSLVLSKSSVTPHFEHGDAFEICVQQNDLGFPLATITIMTAMFVATKTGMIDALRKERGRQLQNGIYVMLVQKFYMAIVIPPSSPSLKYESPEPCD